MTERGARAVALDVLDRIDSEGAYANLALSAALDRSGLAGRDRGFATDLVYGTTRMRRACDFLVDRFLAGEVEPRVRNVLRLGAYQLVFAHVPPHAAVGETVEVAPRRARGLVNAVLRRVAETPVVWPDDAVRLSVPDWVAGQLEADLGPEDAAGALVAMNEPATVAERPDGYVQDLASQQVAASVCVRPGERVADLCAAPGGKTAQLAAAGAEVLAVDRSARRLGRVEENLARLGLKAATRAADATTLDEEPFDAVLLDAPCSATGTIRRHPDVAWTKGEEDVAKLAALQERLLDRAASLVRVGGRLVYCTCSLEPEEGERQAGRLLERHPGLTRVPVEAGEVGGLGELVTRDGDLRTLPSHLPRPEEGRSGLDGFFAIRLVRRS